MQEADGGCRRRLLEDLLGERLLASSAPRGREEAPDGGGPVGPNRRGRLLEEAARCARPGPAARLVRTCGADMVTVATRQERVDARSPPAEQYFVDDKFVHCI